MEGALLILVATVVVGVILWLTDRFYFRKKFNDDEVGGECEPVAGCCGQHAVCEKSQLSIVSADYEYYDDEELDAYRGRKPEEYTESEIEEFREVLYTLHSDEVAGWAKSIQLRNIELPSIIKEELILIISEKQKI